ncbi:hypothetical protein [Thermococcus sp.]
MSATNAHGIDEGTYGFLKADNDGDGIDDKEELELGTDPFNADTDGDYLLDGWELKLDTNPLSKDTDGDGLSDYQEVSQGTNPLKKDTDGDGFDDFEEVKAGTDPTDPMSDPQAPPAVEKPTYSKPKEMKEPPRPKYNYSIEFYINGKKIRPDEFLTLYTENEEVEFEIRATPIEITYPNGSVRTVELKDVNVVGDNDESIEEIDPTHYRISLQNITITGFDFVSFRVSLDYGIRQKNYEFNIEFKYKAQPEVKLLNATWLNNLDVGKIVLECHYCKNVTIIVPGALVNGKPKRIVSFGETMPLKFVYARIIPHRYTLPGENDVGVIYTKYED